MLRHLAVGVLTRRREGKPNLIRGVVGKKRLEASLKTTVGSLEIEEGEAREDVETVDEMRIDCVCLENSRPACPVKKEKKEEEQLTLFVDGGGGGGSSGRVAGLVGSSGGRFAAG